MKKAHLSSGVIFTFYEFENFMGPICNKPLFWKSWTPQSDRPCFANSGTTPHPLEGRILGPPSPLKAEFREPPLSHGCLHSYAANQKFLKGIECTAHMFLQQISTIKSLDRGKRGYFGNHKVISYHLQSTRGAQPPGQLSLYLLNDINSL